MADEDREEGILNRWSKRKRGLVEEENEVVALSSEEQQEADEAYAAELEANREAAESIDLDTIDEESDLSLFMKEGVPQALKKAALAKLWRSNPVFANVDGLVDYDDNFADPNLIMKTFTSAYQVGKGYLKDILEEEEGTEVVAKQSDEPSYDGEEALPSDEEEIAVSENENSLDEIETEPEQIAEIEEDQDEPVVMPKVSLRRRMGLEG